MNRYRVIFALLLFCGVSLPRIRAQDCGEISAIAKMGRAQSTRVLAEASKSAGDSYEARLLYAYSSFHLNPRKKSDAERLLALIPSDKAEELAVLTMGDSQCDEEPIADMESLGRVRDGIPREFARAVLLARTFLFSYVSYSMDATLDPHNDYAMQMKIVCQKANAEFVRAVGQFPEDKQKLFAKHIMNPDSCKPLALPEAEN